MTSLALDSQVVVPSSLLYALKYLTLTLPFCNYFICYQLYLKPFCGVGTVWFLICVG